MLVCFQRHLKCRSATSSDQNSSLLMTCMGGAEETFCPESLVHHPPWRAAKSNRNTHSGKPSAHARRHAKRKQPRQARQLKSCPLKGHPVLLSSAPGPFRGRGSSARSRSTARTLCRTRRKDEQYTRQRQRKIMQCNEQQQANRPLPWCAADQAMICSKLLPLQCMQPCSRGAPQLQQNTQSQRIQPPGNEQQAANRPLTWCPAERATDAPAHMFV